MSVPYTEFTNLRVSQDCTIVGDCTMMSPVGVAQLTTTERLAETDSTPDGGMVFDTDLQKLFVIENSIWVAIHTSSTGGFVNSVTGTAYQIASTGGSDPIISIVSNPTIPGIEGVTVPSGTTGQRASSPNVGQFRFNTTAGKAEIYTGSTWTTFTGGTGSGTVTQIDTTGGIQGGPVTTVGEISLTNTGVVDGTYYYGAYTIDLKGRITSATEGATPVLSVTGTSGNIEITGTASDPILNLGTVITGATYSFGNGFVEADDFGRVVDAQSATDLVTDVQGSSNISSTGGTTPVIDLTASGVTANTYTFGNGNIIFDAKGRATSALQNTNLVTSVSGTSGNITSTGGTTPVIDMATGIVSAGPYAYPSNVVLDTYGRVTGITPGSAPTGGTVTSIGLSTTSGGVTLGGTNPVTGAGSISVDLDADLNALAALSTTGLVSRTGSATYSPRSITTTSAGITLGNVDGVSGNPSVDLDADLNALAALSSTGFVVRTGSATYTNRSVTVSGSNLSLSNGSGVSGNPAIGLSTTLTSLTSAEIGTFTISGNSITSTSAVFITSSSGSQNIVLNANGASKGVQIKRTADSGGLLSLFDTAGSHQVGFAAPVTLSTSTTWLLPTGDAAGAFMSDGSGNMSISSVVSSVGISSTSAGITLGGTNPVTGAGTISVDLDADLNGLAGLSGTGFVVRTGSATYANRSIAVGSSNLTISNTDGVSGNPSLNLATTVTGLTSLSSASLTGGSIELSGNYLYFGGAVAPAIMAVNAGNFAVIAGDGSTTGFDVIPGNAAAALGQALIRLFYVTGGGSTFTVGLRAPVLSSDIMFTLPSADGSSGQFIKTDGSQALSFGSAATSVGLSTTSGGITLGGTNPVTTTGTISVDLDADLNALSALSTTGIVSRTGTSTYSTRTLTTTSAGITLANPGGVSADPSIDLNADLNALAALSTTGLVSRTGSATYSPRSITTTSAGITLGNVDGVSGNPSVDLDADLNALAALSSTGFVVRTGSATYTNRSLTVSGSNLTLSNGSGVSGNPALDLSTTLTGLTSAVIGNLTISGSTVSSSGGVNITATSGTMNIVLTAQGSSRGVNILRTADSSGRLRFFNTAGTQQVGFAAPVTLSASTTWLLPTGDAAGAFMSDGSGNMSIASTVTSVGLSTTSGGITLGGTNPVTTTGTISVDLDADLNALAALSTTGLVSRTGSATYSPRSIAVGSANLTVSNPDGVSGNPSLDLATTVTGLTALTSTTLTGGTVELSNNFIYFSGGVQQPTVAVNTGSIIFVAGNGSTTGFDFMGGNVSAPDGQALIRLFYVNGASTFSVGLKAPVLSSNLTLTLPSSLPTLPSRIVTSTSGAMSYEDYPIQTYEVTLTQAQILGMFASPITLVAAPGANKVIYVDKIFYNYFYTTTAFTAGGAFGPSYGASASWSTVAAGAITNAYSTLTSNAPTMTNTLSTAGFINQALTLWNATTPFLGGNASSTLKVILWYRVLPCV